MTVCFFDVHIYFFFLPLPPRFRAGAPVEAVWEADRFGLGHGALPRGPAALDVARGCFATRLVLCVGCAVDAERARLAHDRLGLPSSCSASSRGSSSSSPSLGGGASVAGSGSSTSPLLQPLIR